MQSLTSNSVVQWFDNPKSGLLDEDWYKNNAKK